MATHTDNYALVKPTYGELADVAVINGNMDTIDGIMHSNRTMLAPAFSQTEDYAVGDVVVYEGNLYRFIVPHTAGNWDGTDVEQTTLGEELSTKGGADVTKTASGNPIEITDGANAPLVKCVTTIQGNQDLHGQTHPWVGGAGKNKLEVTGTSTTVSGVTFTVNNDGTIQVSGTNTSGGSISTTIENVTLPQGTYTISTGNPTGAANDTHFLNINPSETGASQNRNVSTTYTFTDSAETTHEIKIYVRPGKTVNALYKPMIESGSTATAYTPYSNICPITAYTEGEIEVRGKNLFDVNSATSIETPAGQTRDGLYINVAEGDYTFSTSSLSPNGFYIRYKGDTETDWHSTSVSAGGVKTINLVSDGQVCLYVASGNYCSDLVEPMMEKGSTATTYEPYTSTTHTATFSNSIYQGNADFVGGEETHDWIKLVFDGNTYGTYSFIESGRVNIDFDVNYYHEFDGVGNSKTNLYQELAQKGSNSEFNNIASGMDAVYDLSANSNVIALRIKDSRFTDLTTAKNILSQTPLELAIKLATPATETITPTNLPIKSLFGYNHIESTTGDMEIEYITEEFQPLVDLIQSNTSIDVYSTTPQKVGKWFNNEDVYEVCVRISETQGGYQQVDTGISTDAKAWIVEGYAMSSSTETDKYSSPIDAYYSSPNPIAIPASLYKNTTSNHWDITYRIGSILVLGEALFKIRYVTESTTPTRSLNLTKSAVEEIPDEIKNAPFEEKPDVNEADDDAPTEEQER